MTHKRDDACVTPCALRHDISEWPLRSAEKAFPAHDQVEPPTPAAEFTVSRRLQADTLLHRDDLADAVVLDSAQFGVAVRTKMLVRRLRPEQLLSRSLQPRRTQETSDHIGPERRTAHG